MNNTIFARLLILITVVLLIIGFDLWLKRISFEMPGGSEQYYRIVPMPLPINLEFAGEEVPLDMFYVREALDRELAVNTYWHSATLQSIRKTTRWFPVYDSIFEMYNIPDDFKYLSVIESGLSNAVSPAGATGYWQFMEGTAKEYGLEINREIDERYHVVKSTHAACKYLVKSYEKYQNWTLVAAAYNAGQNGISRFMEQQKASSYYDLLLAEETERYVFRILAIKLIIENPENYGFYLLPGDYYQPVPTRKIIVNNKVDSWVDFAAEQSISYKLLKYFNPWLRQTDLKNRNKKTYTIEIPLEPYNRIHKP